MKANNFQRMTAGPRLTILSIYIDFSSPSKRPANHLRRSFTLCYNAKVRRCTQEVIRGRTRNAIGPPGCVGSNPTISASHKKIDHMSII